MLTQTAKYIVLLIWLILSFVFPADAQQASANNDKKLERFLTIAETVRNELNIPGVGIALVADNKLIFTGGLGQRDIENKLPVTENTLFAIGSATKSFTGVLTSKLVEQKKLDWDKPIVFYLPNIRFKDPYLTKHVSMKDLLSHTTGVGRYDLVWYGSGIPRKDLIKRIRYMDSGASLRGEFGYNNVMFVVAGVVQEKVTGKSWDSLIKSEIFAPLGMNSSYTSYDEFMSHPEKSIGYGSDRQTRVPHRNIDNIAPAGSITSTPKDMGKWLLMLTKSGKHGETEFLSKEQFNYLTTPKLITHPSEFGGYAIGWGAGMRNGSKIMSHDGGIDGQNSYTYVRPDLGFGIVVMTNNRSEYKRLITRYAENIFLQNDFSRDKEAEDNLRVKKTAKTEFSSDLSINPDAPTKFAKSEMTGTYKSPLFGEITIEKRGEKQLFMTFNNELKGPVKHKQGNVFAAHIDPNDLPWSLDFEFNGNSDGQIVALSMKTDRRLKASVFKKMK